MSLTRFSAALLLTLFPAIVLGAPATLQDATQAMRKGQNVLALDKVNTYLSNNPKDAQGRFLKGLILTELGRNPDAIKVFTELTEDYPELPEPYNNLAVLYAAQADYERAKQSLEMAIRTHPSYATAHENLGDIYAKLASQAYDKAMQLDKSNVSAQTKLALIQDLFTPGNNHPEAAKPETDTSQVTEVPAPVQSTQPSATGTQTAKAVVDAPTLAPKDAVLAAVHGWSSAWAAQDVPTYLSFYDEEFQTPRGMDRAAWEDQRQARLKAPEYIKLDISQVKVSINGDKATVRFRQRYESNTYRSNDSKTLTLLNRDGDWKIIAER